MSKYYRIGRYGPQKPEDFLILLIFFLILSIFYPPIRPVVMSVWYIYVFAAIGLLGLVFYKIYQYKRLSKSGIYEIDKMSGEEFEERLKILFTKLGFKAERTIQGITKADYGGDLIIEKDGIKTIVQAKRWSGFVGEDAIREAFSAKNIYNCTEAMVVTNSNFSRMAWGLAKSNNVKLWNRNYLVKVLLTERNLTS